MPETAGNWTGNGEQERHIPCLHRTQHPTDICDLFWCEVHLSLPTIKAIYLGICLMSPLGKA